MRYGKRLGMDSRYIVSLLLIGMSIASVQLTQAAEPKHDSKGIDQKSGIGYDPVEKRIHGWTVHVEPALIDGPHASEGKQALRILADELNRIAILVPEEPLTKLRRVEIWLEHKHPELGAMQYHPSESWLVSHGYDRRLAKKVHITQAETLFSRHRLLKHPMVVLHELAHGYHDQVLGFDDPEIRKVYREAKESEKYESVLLYNGDKTRHYGMTDHKEYFAEGTEAYFYRNDFYPFVRAELNEHDPQLHDLLVEIWGDVR